MSTNPVFPSDTSHSFFPFTKMTVSLCLCVCVCVSLCALPCVHVCVCLCVCVHVLLTELWSCLVKPKKIFSLEERENEGERERESERVGREERTRRQIEAAMVTVWRFHDTIYRTGCGAAFISVITAAVACCSVAVTERRAKRVGPQTGTTNSPLYKLQCCLRGPPVSLHLPASSACLSPEEPPPGITKSQACICFL